MLSGLDKKKIFYINFEDERLLNFTVEDFDVLLKSYFELSEFSTKDEDIYFFFDEIQNIKNWEKFITRLVNNLKINIWIT
jgi:predicted AAA+ superfamily ATPase